MITSKKKGQISVEALIIVGVLVVGGIIFATVFLSQMNNQAKQASDLSGLTDSFLDDLGGWGTPGPGSGPGTTPSCGNGICETNLGENNDNCSDCKCGDGLCLPPWEQSGSNDNLPSCNSDCGDSALGFSDLILELVPNESTSTGNSFGIKVKVNTSDYDLANVGKLEIKKDNALTSDCSYNGQFNHTFNNLGKLNASSPRGNVSNTFQFICNVAGNYSFDFTEVTPNGLSSPSLSSNPAIQKTITSSLPPTPPPADELVLSVKITEPENGKLFFKTDNITLRSEYSVSPEQTTQPTYTCIWKDQKNNTLSTQCSGASVSANSLDLGRQEIYLYVTANIGGGALGSSSRILNASDKVEIEILESMVAGQLYLSVPSKNYAGVPFNIRVYSLDQTYPGVINDNSNFIFTNNNSCNVTTSLPSTQTIVVGGQTIYFKDFSTECGSPAYVSCPNALQDILVKATHNDLPQYTAQSTFTSEFDLRFNAATCNSSASETGGSLKVCVFSESGTAKNFNCSNLNYGLLEATVNLAKSNVSNAYGELKIYIK